MGLGANGSKTQVGQEDPPMTDAADFTGISSA